MKREKTKKAQDYTVRKNCSGWTKSILSLALCAIHTLKGACLSERIVVCRGTSLIMVLTKWNAIAEWRRMMGPVDPEEAKLISPDSLRAKYGLDILRNAVHGASNVSEASISINNVFTEDNPED